MVVSSSEKPKITNENTDVNVPANKKANISTFTLHVTVIRTKEQSGPALGPKRRMHNVCPQL